jgi:hypothetical protein
MHASTFILFGTDSNFDLTTLFRKARPLVDLISTDISQTLFLLSILSGLATGSANKEYQRTKLVHKHLQQISIRQPL